MRLDPGRAGAGPSLRAAPAQRRRRRWLPCPLPGGLIAVQVEIDKLAANANREAKPA